MARVGWLVAAAGAAVVAGAGYAVLHESGPQGAVPLAISNPPDPTPTRTKDDVPEPAVPATRAPMSVTATPSSSGSAAPSGPLPTRAPVVPEVIFNGPRDVPKVALTFDTAFNADTAALVASGVYPPQVNVRALDYLQASGTPATVFITGVWAQAYPEVMKRLASTPGMEIENHTWSHLGWTADCYGLAGPADEAAARQEIVHTSQLIALYTKSAPAYIRFPALCHDDEDVALAAQNGETTVDADVTYHDTGATDPAPVVAGILSQVQNGSIILLHLNGQPNAAVTEQILQQLVPALKARGLQPVTLSELLAPTAATAAAQPTPAAAVEPAPDAAEPAPVAVEPAPVAAVPAPAVAATSTP